MDRDTSFVLEVRLEGLPHRIVDFGHGLVDEQREKITLGEHDSGKLEGLVCVVVAVARRVIFDRSLLVAQPLDVALEGARGSSFSHSKRHTTPEKMETQDHERVVCELRAPHITQVFIAENTVERAFP